MDAIKVDCEHRRGFWDDILYPRTRSVSISQSAAELHPEHNGGC